MGKKIVFELTEEGITKALQELEQYKTEFKEKMETFRKRVAHEMEALASNGFNGALVDDNVNAEPRKAVVDTFVDERGNVSVVIAHGEDAVWVEFGAGVYHNGSAGSSPHPMGSELGFTIGSYGKGMGKRKVWGHRENGELILTRGTPSVMPMYNAMKIVCDEIDLIAKEVFG